MSRELAMAYVSSLAPSELAQFFYEAFQHQREIRNIEENALEVTATCIASYYQVVQANNTSDNEPLIYVLAPANNPDDVWSPMDTVQTGYCERCKLQIACATKIAVCPVCDSKVFCT